MDLSSDINTAAEPYGSVKLWSPVQCSDAAACSVTTSVPGINESTA